MSGRCVYGDCRESMRSMIADGVRVQTCVTSPPYFGLRDYQTATWEGGDDACDHKDARQTRGVNSPKQATQNGGEGGARGGACPKCGARRIDAQIGLESTVADYVAAMVDVFRLVRELLADDGTAWVNLGDSYAGSWGAQGRADSTAERSAISDRQIDAHPQRATQTGTIRDAGLKPKDLIGIPWRVAFALQADGWYLRSDIIWHKPNPMPESVTDRPTKAHEYLFLLSKRPTYYYDAAAIAEPCEGGLAGGRQRAQARGERREVRHTNGQPGGNGHNMYGWDNPHGRNRRSVWTVATTPYAGAHFATFPPALIEPCILAGSREGDVVFDPFLGSGTTGEVATRLGRRWLGCELNEAYRPLIEARTAQLGLVTA